jgi:hypothetical protein
MPWYMNPIITCKVLNRIASRNSQASLKELGSLLDFMTQTLWSKQERFLEKQEDLDKP